MLVRLWLAPIAAFWSWYCLSYYDVAPASRLFSRSAHDRVLTLYGDLLGIDPTILSPLVIKSLAVDAVVVAVIMAVRRRRAIAAFFKAYLVARQPSFAANRAESLSSAP